MDYPVKGRTLNFIVPYAPGGPSDVGARLLAAPLEKELGIPVQIVNKAGAGSQIGTTDLVQSKPDGYTMAITNLPTTITIYLDPERKSVFARKDIQPVAMHVLDTGAIGVDATGPYKTLKDLLDAARANPGKITSGSTGVLSINHLSVLLVGQLTGVQITPVHMESSAQVVTGVLGGHLDSYFGVIGDFLPQVKSGKMRLLGIMDNKENPLTPGVPTMESQGVKHYWASSRVISVPAGVPKEVLDILSAAIKKSMGDPEHKQKMWEAGLTLDYRNPEQTTKYWVEMEEQIKPLMALAKQ